MRLTIDLAPDQSLPFAAIAAGIRTLTGFTSRPSIEKGYINGLFFYGRDHDAQSVSGAFSISAVERQDGITLCIDDGAPTNYSSEIQRLAAVLRKIFTRSA